MLYSKLKYLTSLYVFCIVYVFNIIMYQNSIEIGPVNYY